MSSSQASRKGVHHKEFNQLDPIQATMIAGVPVALGTSGFNPFAAVLFFEEFGRQFPWERMKATAGRLLGRRSDLRDELESTLGVAIPVSDDQLPVLVSEVRRYKWLEAERAGRDIWKERNPRHPEASALMEWFRLHFGAWYLHNRRQRQHARAAA